MTKPSASTPRTNFFVFLCIDIMTHSSIPFAREDFRLEARGGWRPDVSRSEGERGEGVFIHDDFLPVGMINVIRVEARVPYRVPETGVRSVPVAVVAEIAIAYMVVNPPAVEVECAGDVVVGRDSAVAVLEGCLSVVAAAAMQGDQAIVALPVNGASAAKNAGSAIGVKIAS